MNFKFWKKNQTKRPKANSLLGADNLDEVLKSICPDNEFIDVLHYKVDGVATDYDECYLDDKLRNDETAMECYELMREKYPEADLTPNCKKRRARKITIILVIALLGMGGAWAFFNIYRSRVESKQTVYVFYQRPVGVVLDSARLLYGKTIVLDQPEIARSLCSGELNPARSLEDFLSYFTFINGLEYYSDTQNVIHIRKAKFNNSTKKLR